MGDDLQRHSADPTTLIESWPLSDEISYLSLGSKRPGRQSLARMASLVEKLDRSDLRILDLLQQDSSLSLTELSKRVGLSSSPCWRRVRRLQEMGLIKRQ